MSYYRVAPGRPSHGPYHDREYGFRVRDDTARVAAYGRRERDLTGGEMARRQPRWMRA